MDKYRKNTKTYKIDNLVLIAEGKNMIQRNIGVSSVCTFLNTDFEDVDFYAARRYVHLTNAGREEDFFVSDEEEKDD